MRAHCRTAKRLRPRESWVRGDERPEALDPPRSDGWSGLARSAVPCFDAAVSDTDLIDATSRQLNLLADERNRHREALLVAKGTVDWLPEGTVVFYDDMKPKL